MRLMAPAFDGTLQPVGEAGLPTDAAWLSADGSTLAVTTLGGAIVLGSARAGDQLLFASGPGDLGGRHPARAFGSLRPGTASAGGAGLVPVRLALIDGDPGSGAPGRLVEETLSGSKVGRFELARAAECAPAWLADGRIVVVVRNQADAPTPLLLDPSNGRLTAVGSGPVAAVSSGGGWVATIAQDRSARIGSVAGWLSETAGEPITGTGPDEPVLQAQPSAWGDELALVVADPAGDAGSVRILARTGGWHEIARFELPRGANRAVVSWLGTP